MNKFIVFVTIISVVSVKSAYPTKTYSAPAYEKPVESYEPQPYSFEWAVKDEYYNDYSHSQSSDGKVIRGSYRIELPDGRAQIVSYKADSNGYTADVKYEGEAQYPPTEYKSATYPAYPAPIYIPPTYKSSAKKTPSYKVPASY